MDITRRIWQQSAEDNVLFLAGGLAFNVLLALLPFTLVVVSGMALLLGSQPEVAVRTVTGLFPALLPNDSPVATELLRSLVTDVYRTRGAVGLYAAIGFAWFSTRLFGSLRGVLALIFGSNDHGIVTGKLFDFVATMVATVGVVVYIAMTAYLDLATMQGEQLLVSLGLRESALTGIGYVGGRLVALIVIFTLFYSLYRGLPRKRPSVRTATIAALSATLLFEAARNVFTLLVSRFDPSSLYTGTIATLVAVVFWTYYGSLLFLIGAEIAHATQMRRIDQTKMERETVAETLKGSTQMRPVKQDRRSKGTADKVVQSPTGKKS